MYELGLVLSGGGGKGAYQIGVWKALREYGLDKNITAISGTSVGALNAVLFMQGDYRLAEKVWMNIKPTMLLETKISDIAIDLTILGIQTLLIPKIINTTSTSLGYNAGNFVFSRMRNGQFSRDGLLKLIDQYLDLKLINQSTIKGWANCCRIPLLKTKFFDLKNCSPDRLKSILLASSALPIMYGAENIDGNNYIDGGVLMNTPIRQLYDQGLKTIVVVHLDKTKKTNPKKFPGTTIFDIIPKNDLGGLLKGTLDFTPEGARRRIKEGYYDTISALNLTQLVRKNG